MQRDLEALQRDWDIYHNHKEIKLNDAELEFFPNFVCPQLADFLLEKLTCSLQWKQESIKIFGKNFLIPRLTSYYGDPNTNYMYSNLLFIPLEWTSELYFIKQLIEQNTDLFFNCVLCNLYRNGKDSMGWHADDEKELGENPVIASINIGAARRFDLKRKDKPKEKYSIILPHGSLLIMKGKIQTYWVHQIAKTLKIDSARINLTYRYIL